MGEWAKSKTDRSQPVLLGPSLDERLGRDHGIRVLDALLSDLDWSEWEGKYAPATVGRPPIHPRLMCGAILYGLLKRIRSTRALEEATRMRLDFQWLLEERTVDHTTFAIFKQRFEEKIGGLFKQINRRAAQIRKATLEEIMVDGTQLRADSNRHGALSVRGLQRRLEQLEERFAESLDELEAEAGEQAEAKQNEQEFEDFEPSGQSGEPLRKKNEDMKRERKKLDRALEEAKRRDAIKRTKDGSNPRAVRVPVSDPDSYILPNKEGGYAPNYTPVVAVESEHGLIVSAAVAEGHGEAATVPALLEQVCELDGRAPHRVVFDSNFASGPNLDHLARRDMEVYAALGIKAADNPAVRPDGTIPVAEALHEKLPMRKKKFDKAAFLYDAEQDCYYCPMGRVLERDRVVKRKNPDGTCVEATEYRSKDCSNCAFAAKCLSRAAKTRRVSRDEHEELREALAARMSTESGEEVYARRAPVVEGTIGTIKSAMGIRRFARRGRRKVEADWLWTCAAFNLGKLIRGVLGPAQRSPVPPIKSAAAKRSGLVDSSIRILVSSLQNTTWPWLLSRAA